MNRRDDSKAETRKLILNAAHSLFWEKGPDKCTFRDIAKEAGVSPASIIVHFKNKTTLLEVTLFEEIENTLGRALATLPSEKELHAVLVHIASVLLAFYDNNRDLYRILIRNTFFEPVYSSPFIDQLDKKYIEFIVTLIDQEKEIGRIRAEVDSSLAASSLFYLYLGVLRIFLTDHSQSVSEAVERLSAIIEQYLAGISTPRGER